MSVANITPHTVSSHTLLQPTIFSREFCCLFSTSCHDFASSAPTTSVQTWPQVNTEVFPHTCSLWPPWLCCSAVPRKSSHTQLLLPAGAFFNMTTNGLITTLTINYRPLLSKQGRTLDECMRGNDPKVIASWRRVFSSGEYVQTHGKMNK